jgi:NAD(P)-dependent dehydrogenase (short-subunit alcohol dehydrogenase family)
VTDAQTDRSAIPWATRSLSVFVPAYNEVDNLTPTVETIMRALSVSVEDYEVIVVDDGSTDGTYQVADALAARYPEVLVIHNPRNMGLGYGWMRAIEAASKSSFIFVPGDDTWPYRSLLELFGNLGKADVVTSFTTNPEIRSPVRRVLSSIYTASLNLLFGLDMQYYHGLTIYPSAFLRAHPITTYGFASMAEALLRAIHEGLSFIEVACVIEERAKGRSKALTAKNLASIGATIGRLFVDLRLREARGPHSTLGLRGRAAGAPGRGPAPRMSEPGQNGVAPGEASSGDAVAPERPLRVVVTGGSSGIGAEIVRSLAEDGHQVYTCARRRDRLDAVTHGDTIARGFVCDVGDEAQVTAFVAWIHDQTDTIDVLVNCAGAFGAIGPVAITESDAWFDTIRVNLFGTYLVIKHLLPTLAKSPDPRIINFSGGGAFSPFPNYSAYACSKAAIVRLTECLAAELAPQGITVNALAPGFIPTEAHEKTLEAGAERAGGLHFRRTRAVLAEGGAPLAAVVECLNVLISPKARGLTGKTISANFDPWRTEAFVERLADITRSDLWTMRRVNIVNLPEGSLRTSLGEAWANYGVRR